MVGEAVRVEMTLDVTKIEGMMTGKLMPLRQPLMDGLMDEEKGSEVMRSSDATRESCAVLKPCPRQLRDIMSVKVVLLAVLELRSLSCVSPVLPSLT